MKNIVSIHPFFYAFFGLFFVFVSCKSEIEHEQQKWQENTLRIKQLIDQYPGLQNILQQELTAAEKWLEKETDSPATEIDNLRMANRLLTDDFILQLSEINESLNKLAQKRKKVLDKLYTGNKLREAQMAADEAADIEFYTLKNLQNTQYTRQQLIQVVQKANKDIQYVEILLNQVLE